MCIYWIVRTKEQINAELTRKMMYLRIGWVVCYPNSN